MPRIETVHRATCRMEPRNTIALTNETIWPVFTISRSKRNGMAEFMSIKLRPEDAFAFETMLREWREEYEQRQCELRAPRD